MLYSFAAAIVFALGVSAEHSRETYELKFFDWMNRFDVKISSGEEFVHKLETFIENDKFIDEHNASGATYRVAHNQFSMYTVEEFSAKFLRPIPKGALSSGTNKVHVENLNYPASWDWTTQGAVTGVKDQGNCGSCWAFSATGSLEGAYFLNAGSLVSFSEQELVDCDTYDAGCSGGLMDRAFRWIGNNNGLCTESAYPYTSGNTGTEGTCAKASCTSVSGSDVTTWTDVATESQTAMLSAVYLTPVSVAIQANQIGFQMYSSGVFTGRCGDNLDHGVLAVGYGTDSGTDFWKVKNSWGTSWGEAGYIRMERGMANCDQCGILCGPPSYPSV